jgi:hypothetical protein
MVRTFLKVYMELGSYFLFLQEQIKDIIMWFAIAPLMPTMKKPKCESADSEVCKACLVKFPNEDMKFWGETQTPTAPKGALDAKCKVCYPYEGRAKGRAG